MNNFILIRAQQKSDWVSCQSIVSNLEESYRKIFPEVKVFYFNRDDNELESYQIAKEIIASNADEIIFIDHTPHPANIIRRLHQISPAYKPTLSFHIFGDFVLHSAQWYELSGILQNYPLNFICASNKQQDLIASFLNNTQNSSLTPFPVMEDAFYFNEEERRATREKWGLKDTDFLFLYTGRVSQQKNVLELVKAFNSCLKLSNDEAYLYFAGPFDDMGIPYKGQDNPHGAYFQRWENIHQSINQTNIKYIFNLNATELRQAYNAADYFISLSTHNDEDFGMSPAEAALCGLPLILSDWGGYSSFKTWLKDDCTLVPINLDDLRPLPDLSNFRKQLYKSLNQKPSLQQREVISQKAQRAFSINAVSQMNKKRLSQAAPPLFEGFNSHFYKLSAIFKSSPYSPFNGSFGKFSSFYFDIYAPYMEKSP